MLYQNANSLYIKITKQTHTKPKWRLINVDATSIGRHFGIVCLLGSSLTMLTSIFYSRLLCFVSTGNCVKLRQTFYSCLLCFVLTGNRGWSSDRHFTLAYLALYRQGIVSEVQADILLSLTWLCIDRESWVKFRQTFYSRILGFISTGNCEWSSGRHFTLAHLALYRQGIVSEVQADILLSLTWLCIDREFWVKFRQTFYSRILGFVSTRNCKWRSDRHFTLTYLALYRQGIVSEVKTDILLSLTWLWIDRALWVKFR